MTEAILTLNAGSSSVKFAVYGSDADEPDLLARGQVEGIGTAPRFVVRDDGGELLSESYWEAVGGGEGHNLAPQWEIDFPHSLGLLYSAFTYFTGFKVNSGEYKLMGLAPYGEPVYVDLILDKLVDVKEDGSFRLDMSYFNYATGLTMTNRKFDDLFGGERRLRGCR